MSNPRGLWTGYLLPSTNQREISVLVSFSLCVCACVNFWVLCLKLKVEIVEAKMAVEAGKKMMVAIDESGSSYYALTWVLENFRESINSSGNPLLIFMAQPSPSNNSVFTASLGGARMYCPILPTTEYVNSVQQQNKVVSLGILDKAKRICTSHGVNAETIAEIGDPKQAICDAVQKYNINLLVLGDHELGKIKRALLGSVSNYCVHNASCPVLVVKKPE